MQTYQEAEDDNGETGTSIDLSLFHRLTPGQVAQLTESSRGQELKGARKSELFDGLTFRKPSGACANAISTPA